ncbi:MAG: DEAD/DEAH box helicase family protein [Bacilli bacterium]|jgi:superfamily II DNA or RNA helicase
MSFENIYFKGSFRSYQQRVLDSADLYLTDGKINIVAAPGSGKTILGLELIRRLGKPCIILSPTTTIREQWGERFKESFLPKGLEIKEYVNYDLNKIVLINSITYQALYSAMNKIKASNEDETIDYSNIDLFKLIKEKGIKTICLDEAHHLQNEWQKALEKFIKGLAKDIKVISLTATPPYDANTYEWQRYISVCGEIDEEIFVPELVKEKTLCPHQDYIMFNYPTENEIKSFKEYKEKSFLVIEEIGKLEFIIKLNEHLNKNYKDMLMDIYTNVKEYIALLILFRYYDYPINKKIIKILTDVEHLPDISLQYAEIAIQFLINSVLLKEEEKEILLKLLKQNSLYDKKQVFLDLDEKLKRKLISSLGKMESILKIVDSEYASLNNDLKMLILTDYIKKESLFKVGTEKLVDNVSVVSIFETIRRLKNINLGVLSGSLVILPNTVIEVIKDKYQFSFKNINDTTYSTVNFKGSNKDKVRIVSSLFKKGSINILIGTKSLLGEGWDSPCINSLILASFVGSFMLSNQMRGRAIRIDKNDPEKVSNIWHLVTIEPDYVFEDNKVKKISLYLSRPKDIIQSNDYETLVRRFECFVGPSYDKDEIESGIDRISNIKPPYNKKGIEKINEETLALSKNRALVKEKWDNALSKSSKMQIESKVPIERKIPAFTFYNIGKILLILSFQSLILSLNALAISNVTLSSDFGMLSLIVTIVLSLISTIFIMHATKMLIANANPTRQIKSFSKCILKTLKDIDLIESACTLKVKSDSDGIFINVSLVDATIHEQNIFNKAIAEFLNPIENPRYIVIKKGLVSKYNYKYSFACPSVIGKNKEIADLFNSYLSKIMGKYSLVYTRYEEGRKFILKCRIKSYISYNAKQVNSKHKITRWE